MEPSITPKINKVMESFNLKLTKNSNKRINKAPIMAAKLIEKEELMLIPNKPAPITKSATPKPAPELIPKI